MNPYLHDMYEQSDLVNLVVDLAKHCVTEHPINWDALSVSQDEAYKLVAMGVIDLIADKYESQEGKYIMLSTIVNLIVENFSLNLQLLQKEPND